MARESLSNTGPRSDWGACMITGGAGPARRGRRSGYRNHLRRGGHTGRSQTFQGHTDAVQRRPQFRRSVGGSSVAAFLESLGDVTSHLNHGILQRLHVGGQVGRGGGHLGRVEEFRRRSA